MESKKINKIVLLEDLSDQMFSLCMNKDGADVEFSVEEERIPAHRIVLATRCQYFRSLLFNGLLETFERVVVLSVKLKPFKAILIYLYTGQLHFSLGNSEEANIYDVLELAHEYMIENLMSSISETLSNQINLENFCDVLNTATKYNITNILNACFGFINVNALDVVEHDSTKSLTQESLFQLTKCDRFSVEEIYIFRMVVRWRDNNPTKDINPIIENVRFSLMNFEELVTEVQDSGLLGPQMLVKMFTEKTLCRKLPLRSLQTNSLTVFCKIDSSQNIIGKNFTFEMSKISLINNIEICCKDCSRCRVSTSLNNKEWINIGEEDCYNSVKEFNFNPTEALYIRVISYNEVRICQITARYINKI